MFNFFMGPNQVASVEGEVAMYEKLKEVLEWTWDFILTKVGYYQEEGYETFNEEEDNQKVHNVVETDPNQEAEAEKVEEEKKKTKGSKIASAGDINIEITPIEETKDHGSKSDIGYDNLIVSFKNDNVSNV